MNSDQWSATCSAFLSGAREEASNHARQALRETSESNTILHGIHTSNLRAIDSDRTNQTSQVCQTPVIPVSPNTAPLSLRLYIHRVSLITAHNHLLVVLNYPLNGVSQNDSQHEATDLRQSAINFLLDVLRDVSEFVDEILLRLPKASFAAKTANERQSLSPRNFKRAKRRTYRENGIYDWAWDVSSVVQDVMNHAGVLSEKLSSDELVCLEGWARSVADAFDLAVAATIIDMSDDGAPMVMEATAYASAAQALRILARTARPVGQCDDITNNDADLRDARTVWLQALSLAKAGDEEAALKSVLPTAKAALESRLEERTENEDTNNAGEEAMYLASVLLIRRGGQDVEESAEFARGCAERMFRTADSLALVARAGTGKAEDVERWAVALAVDGSPRPAGLWLASRAFGRIGMYDRQAEILELAEDALVEDENGDEGNGDMQDDAEDEKGDGVVRLNDRNDMHEVLEHGENIRSCLEVESLKAERGRALCAAGRLEEGKALLQEGGVLLVSGKYAGAQLAVEWALADRAMTREEADRGLSLEETLKLMNWECVGIFIARAERMLRGGFVLEARRAIEEAMRIGLQSNVENNRYEAFLRGICYGNMAVVRVCDGDVAGADEWFAAAQTALDKSIEEDTVQNHRSSFARFASSQSALDREGLQLRTLTTIGRCIAMAMCGRRSDAAGHWVAKRELSSASVEGSVRERSGFSALGQSTGTKEPPVLGEETPVFGDQEVPGARDCVVTRVSKETLLKMDEVCLDIARQASTNLDSLQLQ